MNPIVIIGSGLAGYTLTREFRKLDRQTPLALLAADDGALYSKPMLCNALAAGKAPAQLVNKPAHAMAQELDAEIARPVARRSASAPGFAPAGAAGTRAREHSVAPRGASIGLPDRHPLPRLPRC